jgi:predicted nucleotidyltransferase
MSEIVTVAERKARETERLRKAADCILAELTRYAALHRGRFLVFGSVATGALRPDSDFDVVIDFPVEAEREAINEVETVCTRYGMDADVHSARTSGPNFLKRISGHCKVIS